MSVKNKSKTSLTLVFLVLSIILSAGEFIVLK